MNLHLNCKPVHIFIYTCTIIVGFKISLGDDNDSVLIKPSIESEKYAKINSFEIYNQDGFFYASHCILISMGDSFIFMQTLKKKKKKDFIFS